MGCGCKGGSTKPAIKQVVKRVPITAKSNPNTKRVIIKRPAK